jgi:hypothetical protein
MTESDDKVRWILAYILFGLAELLAIMGAYKLSSHNAFGYLVYGLPFIALVPIVSARRALGAFKTSAAIQSDSALRLQISMQLWMLVVGCYTLFIFAEVTQATTP